MRVNRFDSTTSSSSLSTQANANAHQPQQEIVLLEDKDLYKYHQQHQHQQHQQHDPISYRQHQQPGRPSSSFAKVSIDYDDGHARRSLTMTAPPSYRASEASSDVATQRHFHLQATPYAATASSMRKPSITSMDTVPLSHGALRPGGAVDLFSRQYIGLLLNWALVGYFNGSVPALVTPLLDPFMGYSVSQTNAASALLTFPWLFKFVAGFLSDCVPINRQRRKPYILMGWTVFMLFMVAMSSMKEPRPYKKQDEIVYNDAVSQGSRYVIPLVAGSFAHLLSTVAVEGMMIECAQREGEFVRGRTQSLCLMIRFLGEFLGGLSMTLALNSPDFGGHFRLALPLRLIFGWHAALAALGIVITTCWLQEERTATSTQRLATQLRRIWNILQQTTTWQITAFGFLAKVGTTYEIQEHRKIYKEWLHADSLTLNVTDAISSMGFLIAAAVFMRFLINANWRKILVVSVTIGLLVMVPGDVVTVFDVSRSLPVYLTKAQLVSVADAFLYILRVVAIVEVAEPGYEAVTYGIITTVFNLATLVVSMAKNVVASGFSPTVAELERDTSAVRWHVMAEFLFKYGLRVAMVLLVLPLLPRQKRHLAQRKVQGTMTIVVPMVLFVVFAALFAASVTSNTLALFESTSCLIFAGGKGCGMQDTP